MSKRTKTLLVVAAALTVAGLAVATVSAAAVDFRFEELNTENGFVEKTFSFDPQRLQDIEVEAQTADVSVVCSDDRAGTVLYYESDKEEYDVAFSDAGRLSIRYRSRREWYDFFSVNFGGTDKKIVVYVPQAVRGSVKLTTVSGRVEVAGLRADGSLDAGSTSGTVEISGAAAGALKAHTVSGLIQVEHTSVSGDADVSTTSGDVRLDALSLTGSLTGSSVSGRMELKETAAEGSVQLGTVSGDCRFSQLSGADIGLSTTSGSIRGDIRGAREDYSVSAKSVSGAVDAPQTENGPNRLELSTVSGDISVRFAD